MALTDKLTAIADAIRTKTGSTEKLTLAQMPTEIAGIQAGGGENLLDYAVSVQGLFQNVNFGGGKELTLSFGSKSNAAIDTNALKSVFFRAIGIKSIKVIYAGPSTTSVYCGSFCSAGSTETELEQIDLTQLTDKLGFGGSVDQLFYGRSGLKEILGDLDFSEAARTSNVFANCLALENVRFKVATIKTAISFANSANLTDATIQSIIDGLADLTDGTAQTLALHATVGAKLTDEQKSAASAKNWTISY